MNPMLKILRINMCIQQLQVKVSLDGKEIEAVCLDGSWSTRDGDYDPKRFLTDAQLDDLFRQTFGANTATVLSQE